MAKPRNPMNLVLLLMLATGVSVYVLWELGGREDAPLTVTPPDYSTPAPTPAPTRPASNTSTSSTPASASPAAVNPAAAPPAVDYASEFRETADYLGFARSIQHAAKAGDVTAQFYLYRAIELCQRGGAAPLEERCRTFRETSTSDLGEGDQWLQMAAMGGQPRAQAVYAGKLLADSRSLPHEEADRSRGDARRQLSAALASRDPEVVFETASLLVLRKSGAPPGIGDTASWWLAACTRGLDCSATAERTRQICARDGSCQPFESLPDVLRRDSMDYAAVEARAAEINRLLDAGDLNALGFDP